MVADHPTENDTTDLTMLREPAAPVPAADSQATSAPLAAPVSVEMEGGLGDAATADGAVAVESNGMAAGGDQAPALTDRHSENGGESAEGVDETGADESRAVAEADESPEDVGEAMESVAEEELKKDWYILKVQVNREDSIRDALLRRVKIEGLEPYFGDIIVPTEEVAEFNKSGKRRVVRRKLYPGYILVHMAINDDTWFVVRETPGVGDFTGSAGKPTPMEARDVDRILRLGAAHEERGGPIKTAIPFKSGDRVRVKDGHFQNFEGEVDAIDEANGRITVMINIFNRLTPVELEHWQVESV